VLAAVTLTGYVLSERNTAQQEQVLLQSTTNQAAVYASQIFAGLGTSLNSIASLVTSSNGSPAAFVKAEQSPSPLVNVLVKKAGTSYVVVASSGPKFRSGEILSGAELATVKGSKGKLTAGPVTSSGKQSTARFAIGAPAVPAGYVVYEQFTINVFTSTPVTTGKAFSLINATLYGAGTPSSHNLLISTSSTIPLNGPTARAKVPVGASNWTLIASARGSFIGGFARASSLLLLILGLLMVLVIGITIEVLHRRQRYSEDLVQQRTAELEESLRNLEEAQVALVRGERLTAVGEMAMVVGHELRNPLAAVTNALFLIRSQLKDPMSDLLSRNLSMAERETSKAATLADDLTAFVRPREVDKAHIEVEDLVDEVISASPPPSGVELITTLESKDLVADRGQMAEVLTNLVTNAYQAIPGGGVLKISASDCSDGIRLIVEDSGPGVDDAVAARIFEPFFTTKYTGTGLGLAIVQRLVNAHGGTVEFENVPTGGARVTVVLPDEREMATT